MIYMEHKDNWALEGEVPDEADYLVPPGAARLARTEGDLILVTWSKMVGVAEQAAVLAAAPGHRDRGHRPAHPVAMGSGNGVCLGGENQASDVRA